MARTKAFLAGPPAANSASTPAGIEQPSSSARLRLELGPDRVGGLHLITTFGLMGTGVSGISGAVLMVYIAPHLAVLALAPLLLALAIAVLIAVCARSHTAD